MFVTRVTYFIFKDFILIRKNLVRHFIKPVVIHVNKEKLLLILSRKSQFLLKDFSQLDSFDEQEKCCNLHLWLILLVGNVST